MREWTFPSSSTDAIYTVCGFSPETLSCSCPGFAFRKTCWHVRSAANNLRDEGYTLPVGTRVVLTADHRYSSTFGMRGWRGVITEPFNAAKEALAASGGYRIRYDHGEVLWANASAVAPESFIVTPTSTETTLSDVQVRELAALSPDVEMRLRELAPTAFPPPPPTRLRTDTIDSHALATVLESSPFWSLAPRFIGNLRGQGFYLDPNMGEWAIEIDDRNIPVLTCTKRRK